MKNAHFAAFITLILLSYSVSTVGQQAAINYLLLQDDASCSDTGDADGAHLHPMEIIDCANPVPAP